MASWTMTNVVAGVFMNRALQCLLALFTVMLVSTSVLAGNELSSSLFPTVVEPADKSLTCIQPEDEMRRNHMNYILHERNETVYQGIRNEPGSLAACIDCHVEPNSQGEIAGIESKQHFCSACHQHAAVQIDCFECHADRPQKYITRAGQTSSTPSIAQQLQQTLRRHENVNESDTQQ